MPSFIDTSTASRFVLNPLLVYIGTRRVGPTRGGVTISIARDIVQPEMDGVNQGIVGAKYVRSETATVEFSVVELGEQNFTAANMLIAGTGTTPNLTYSGVPNMTLLTTANYLPTEGFRGYAQFTDPAIPGYYFFSIPNGIITAVPEFGASGEATLKFTITSEALASAPDAKTFSWGRVATLPAEVGGP